MSSSTGASAIFPFCLQVQPFWLSLTLRLHHALPSTPKIGHLHPHSPLSQSPQACLGANGLDICTGKIVLLVDKLIKVDVVVERHFGSVEVEDLAFGDFYDWLDLFDEERGERCGKKGSGERERF